MARAAKKETALTAEEKLSQVLVPEVEQPYQVPENWCWVGLSQIANLYNGDRGVNYPSKKDYVETGIPFINAGAIQEGKLDSNEYNYITQEKYNSLRAGKIQENDILYCLRGSLGKTAIVDFDSHGAISSSLCILRVRTSVVVKYLYYLLSSTTIEKQQDIAENGSAQPNLSAASVLKYKIPLPPLAEQQRIVDRIDSLFAKLDEAKEKAQAVVDGFEDRIAAILHKAFTGELTAEWRKQNHINDFAWDLKPLSSITDNHDSKRIPLSKGERANLDRKYDYYGASGVIDQVDRYLFDGKYLLIGEDGANLVTRSKPIAFIAEGQYWVNNHAHILSTRDMIVMEFLCYFINSIDLIPYVTGSAQPKMTQAKMNTIPIPVPTIEEQLEIVRILDKLIAGQTQAAEAAEQVIDQIDTMKKAILARAFRGELGTNDPADESAEELLKRVL